MVRVPLAVARRLSELEADTPRWFDEMSWTAELEALMPAPASLDEDERRGCISEIVAHRFMPATSSERGPWDVYFGPVSSGTDSNGNEIHFPDARQIEAEVIEYWKFRAGQTSHPLLRARYADLAWEIGRIWNRAHGHYWRTLPCRCSCSKHGDS